MFKNDEIFKFCSFENRLFSIGSALISPKKCFKMLNGGNCQKTLVKTQANIYHIINQTLVKTQANIYHIINQTLDKTQANIYHIINQTKI